MIPSTRRFAPIAVLCSGKGAFSTGNAEPLKVWRVLRGMKLSLCLLAAAVLAVGTGRCELKTQTWNVDGVERKALVAVPRDMSKGPIPVVFVFHGHGGSMQNAARTFALETLWPEALVVYPQGLPTPGLLTDPSGARAGWQSAASEQGDRDLAFVDAMVASLKKDYPVDAHRVFATGHSNGGAFTYLLWARRADVFSAFAPSSGMLGRNAQQPTQPRPVLHIAGRKDPLVKFAWQEIAIALDRRINDCEKHGTPWAPGGDEALIYHSKVNAPVVTWIHSGGHRYPSAATKAIVAFFKGYEQMNGPS